MKKLLAAVVVLSLVIAFVARGGASLPDTVQPIAWNAEPCAHCHMLIGDPGFAAQVITDDGTVQSFDDPGCAARYIRAHRDHIHRAWFHAGRGDRWIPLADVRFVRVTTSPMGSGVMAVGADVAGSMSLAEVP